MSVELLQAGAQSATLLWTFPTGDQYADWAALPAGKLKDVLNRVYLTAGGDIDPVGFWRAFGTAGGSTTAVAYLGLSVGNPTWILSEGDPGDPPKGAPILRQDTGANGRVLVRIQVSYSASE